MKRTSSDAKKEFTLDGCFVCQEGKESKGDAHPKAGTLEKMVGFIRDR